VCKSISELHEKGNVSEHCKATSSVCFSVSLTTIERIWAARKEATNQTVREAVNMLNVKEEPKAT